MGAMEGKVSELRRGMFESGGLPGGGRVCVCSCWKEAEEILGGVELASSERLGR
jgi:hypothetical protein